MTQPAPRVRVTRTRTSEPARPPSLRSEITTQSPLGATYLDSLVRAQRRLTVRVLGTLVAVLVGLLLTFALVPASRRLELLGLPLPWLLLGVVLYPAAVLVAWRYTRGAERIEAQFDDVVGDR